MIVLISWKSFVYLFVQLSACLFSSQVLHGRKSGLLWSLAGASSGTHPWLRSSATSWCTFSFCSCMLMSYWWTLSHHLQKAQQSLNMCCTSGSSPLSARRFERYPHHTLHLSIAKRMPHLNYAMSVWKQICLQTWIIISKKYNKLSSELRIMHSINSAQELSHNCPSWGDL